MNNLIIMEAAEKDWGEITETIEADLRSSVIDAAIRKNLKSAWSNVREYPAGSFVLEPDARISRVLDIGQPSEPYIIAHSDPSHLTDAVLNSHFAAFRSDYGKMTSAEDFENFLYHLRDERGYNLILTADEPLDFILDPEKAEGDDK